MSVSTFEMWAVEQVSVDGDGFEVTLVCEQATTFGDEEEQEPANTDKRRRYLRINERADAQFFAVRIGGLVRLTLEWEDAG